MARAEAAVMLVRFYSAQSIGQQVFNRCAYFIGYNDGKPFISVGGFKSDRPEMEPGWSSEDPDGYKMDYIKKEQARLDAPGYGI